MTVERRERSPEPRTIGRATITEQLEEALRTDIQVGILRPGQKIRANEVAERYGVSATPLREALQRLAGESLIEIDPRLGATVAPMSTQDLQDIYGMLGLLDGLALERSIARGDGSWLRQVEVAWDALVEAAARHEQLSEGSSDEERREIGLRWSAAHWRFHEALYRACDSPWLMRFVRQLHAHADRYQMLTMRGPRRDARAEHAEILEAARARNVDAAVAALKAHLGLTVRLLGEEIERARAASAAEAASASAAAAGNTPGLRRSR
jgi:DNA-binding GntR family transcriptional regulator